MGTGDARRMPSFASANRSLARLLVGSVPLDAAQASQNPCTKLLRRCWPTDIVVGPLSQPPHCVSPAPTGRTQDQRHARFGPDLAQQTPISLVIDLKQYQVWLESSQNGQAGPGCWCNVHAVVLPRKERCHLACQVTASFQDQNPGRHDRNPFLVELSSVFSLAAHSAGTKRTSLFLASAHSKKRRLE